MVPTLKEPLTLEGMDKSTENFSASPFKRNLSTDTAFS
jgi:hypothetical protein